MTVEVRALCLCVALCAAGPATARTQEEASAKGRGEVTLTDREVEEIAKLLGAWEEAGRRGTLKAIREQKKLRQKLGELFARLRQQGREPLKAVHAWWRIFASDRYMRYGGKLGRQTRKTWNFRLRGRAYPVVYSLSVPAGYRHRSPWPLVLGLHPVRGKMQGVEFMRQFWGTRELREAALVVAPDLPRRRDLQDAGWSHRRLLYASFGLLGGLIFREYNVDRNALFLDGYGDGAREVWRLASRFADNFAGVIVRGAAPPPETRFRDFLNTPVLLVGVPGTDLDPERAEAVGREMRAAGVDVTVVKLAEAPRPRHERNAFKTVEKDILAFVARKRRNPYPERLEWSVKENNTRRCFYLKSTGELEDAVVSAADRKHPPSFAAHLDRKQNRLVVQTHRILGLRVEMNDLLLDLDRPVTIVIDGKVVFEGRPERSFDTLLDAFYTSGDWARVYPWRVTVQVPRHKASGPEADGRKPPKAAPIK